MKFHVCVVLLAGDVPPNLDLKFKINYKLFRYKKLRLFFVQVSDKLHLGKINSALESCGFSRLYERFYFKNHRYQKKGVKLVEQFYRWHAGSYKSCGNNVNVACYNKLLEFYGLNSGVLFGECLDFGCGSGNILYSRIALSFSHIIGFDICEQMRILSKRKGLDSLSPIEFSQLDPAQFDLIVSSYVFHYFVGKFQVYKIIELLRPGGFFIANFHKDIAVAQFKKIVSSEKSLNCLVVWKKSEFGLCVVLKKL